MSFPCVGAFAFVCLDVYSSMYMLLSLVLGLLCFDFLYLVVLQLYSAYACCKQPNCLHKLAELGNKLLFI